MGVSLSLPARLGAFYFAFFAFSAAYVAYFPAYLASRGLMAAEIALVLALPQLGRIVAPAAWGWLADRTGAHRGIVVLSCGAMTACFALLPHAPGLLSMAVLVGITGLFSAGALPLVEAITLGAVASPGRYGPIRLWGSVGFIAVVLAGGVWLEHRSSAIAPVALAVFALGALACAAAFPRGRRRAAGDLQKVALPRGAAALLAAGLCMGAAHAALYAFFTIHLQAAGYGGVAIGILWTLGVVAEIFVFALLPALFRRYTLSAVLIFSFLCAVVRFMAIGWGISHLWLLCLVQVLHAATFGTFHAASVAAVQRLFPGPALGRGQGLFSSASYGAGGAAGALVAGWSWQAIGPEATFTLAALFGLAGAYFAYALRRAGL
jgi:PPP family 3-phenylpropionic acid transporter